jgi:hypothetical protein
METAAQPMIKANELRLGNWVKGNGYYKIEFIDHQTDGYEPIPLTPEILEKCGFEKSKGYIDFNLEITNNHLLNYSDEELSVFVNSQNEHGYEAFITPCKHLHQLQNLYFALTGSELEINL